MRAAGHIMNDDLESAEAGLANGTSSFHKVHYLAYALPDLEADAGGKKELSLMPIFCWGIDGKGNGCFLKSHSWI